MSTRYHWSQLPEEYQTFTSPLPKQKYMKHADLSDRKKKSIEADGFPIMRQSFVRKSNDTSMADMREYSNKRASEKKYKPLF